MMLQTNKRTNEPSDKTDSRIREPLTPRNNPLAVIVLLKTVHTSAKGACCVDERVSFTTQTLLPVLSEAQVLPLKTGAFISLFIDATVEKSV